MRLVETTLGDFGCSVVQFALQSRKLDYRLELTDKVPKNCVAWADPVYRARPLKRAIQTHLENPCKLLLKGEFAAGTTGRALSIWWDKLPT